MVTYVLLVIIAISISVFVYAYLKLYLPENRRECEIDSKIVITEVSCIADLNHGDLSFKIENRGLFNISGVYVKFDNSAQKVRSQISGDDARLHPPLAPNQAMAFDYQNVSAKLNISNLVTSENAYTLEVEPAIMQEGFLVPCKDSIVEYQVTCRVL